MTRADLRSNLALKLKAEPYTDVLHLAADLGLTTKEELIRRILEQPDDVIEELLETFEVVGKDPDDQDEREHADFCDPGIPKPGM